MMFTFGSAASENDGVNGDSVWGLPRRVYDGALASRGTKARVGMGTGLLVTWQSTFKCCHFHRQVHFQHTHLCRYSYTISFCLISSPQP